MRQNPRAIPAFKSALKRLRDSVKKAENLLKREPPLKSVETLRDALNEMMGAANDAQNVRRSLSSDSRDPSGAYTRLNAEMTDLRTKAGELQPKLRAAIVDLELTPSAVKVSAKISQTSYDVTVRVKNTDPQFKATVEDVAERILTYVNMNDVSADYTIEILGKSTETSISADLDLDILTISVACPLNVDSQDIIEQIVEGLVIVWDLEDPDFDDDVMGVLAEI